MLRLFLKGYKSGITVIESQSRLSLIITLPYITASSSFPKICFSVQVDLSSQLPPYFEECISFVVRYDNVMINKTNIMDNFLIEIFCVFIATPLY
jgi:hypothetical protein